MGYEPPFQRNSRIDELSMQIAELVGELRLHESLRTDPHLHRKLRIRTIRSSLMIEGNTLSEDAVSAIIDGKPVIGPATDILEVANAREAYALMPEVNVGSIEDLLKVHGVMMGGLTEDAGCFRNKNVGVFEGEQLIHTGTPARYVPELVGELFEWIRSTKLHPLVASCIFHYEFEFIHPFSDGNGRVGRFWHTSLLRAWRPILAWIPIETVILARQQEYYEKIAASNRLGSSELFVEFMLEVIVDAIAPFTAKNSEAVSRAQMVLDFFATNDRATITDCAAHFGLSQRSVERTVRELKEERLLRREGSARAGRWIVATSERD